MDDNNLKVLGQLKDRWIPKKGNLHLMRNFVRSYQRLMQVPDPYYAEKKLFEEDYQKFWMKRMRGFFYETKLS